MAEYRRRLVVEFKDQEEADRVRKWLKILVAAEGKSIRVKLLELIEKELKQRGLNG